MYSRDLLTAEVKKLADTLAKIFGLKNDGQLEEAQQQLDDLLNNEFQLSYDDLIYGDPEAFQTYLSKAQLPAEKLDLLGQVVYSEFDAHDPSEENHFIARKLQIIYRMLENEHKMITMTNLNREKILKNYLN